MKKIVDKDISEWTRKDFDAWRNAFDEELECTSIVILPLRRLHDSGYRCMDFVAVNHGKPICRCAGGSDVLHIDGIGGCGQWTAQAGLPLFVKPKGWSIDCLRTSGLLQLWPSKAGCNLRIGSALSSFEVFGVEKKEEAL